MTNNHAPDLRDPLYAIDFYKVGHVYQYPRGTEVVYSNWTPRKSRLGGVQRVAFFGLQYYVLEYLMDRWHEFFFDRSIDDVCEEYAARMAAAGISTGTDHLRQLHDYGFMPLEIRAVPEGSLVKVRTPMFTVHNTEPDAFWLTNYIETQISAVLWPMMTAATIAARYRRLLEDGMRRTGGPEDFVDVQGHDFSCRGMLGTEGAALTGAGHLLSFMGTDTVQAIDLLVGYYGADRTQVGGSIPATEHSVMCMGGRADERETYERLLTQVYPDGPISIVSDTWDYWQVLTETLPSLRDEILARDGKLVIRPDSGDPVDVIAGHEYKRGAERVTAEEKGTFETLWEIFGGTHNAEGYRQLNPKIGVIYGDSITFERASAIQHRLIETGFVPDVVYGIGSYTYQMNTRDTFGFAMKATAGRVKGEVREIFKDPKTDAGGEKKSLRGFIRVEESVEGEFSAFDQQAPADIESGALGLVFRNGRIERRQSLGEIRANLLRRLRTLGLN